MKSSIDLLRGEMKKRGVKAYIIPNNDEFGNEYLPDSAKRLEYLTGFTGSAGTAVVGITKAAFFTDGRYTLQAANQIDSKIFEVYNISEKRPEEWIYDHQLDAAFDPWLMSARESRRYNAKPLNGNLVDIIWPTKPAAPTAPAKPHKIEYAGETSESKRTRIAARLQGADMALITAPDSLNWLLNIRGNDIKYTPICLAYGVLHKSGKLDLYISRKKATFEILNFFGKDIKLKEPHQIMELKGKILLDPARTPLAIYQALYENGAEVIEGEDPCVMPKACKNPTEIAGIRAAHQIDGRAVTKFLRWVKKQKEIDENWAAIRLEEFRKESPDYVFPSFNTISGFGANGAIVHYDHTKNPEPAKFTPENLYLVDSGAQYEFGTTDITRTIAIGEPTQEMKRSYTLVLKGHIALASAKFPRGTTGSQLDPLARQFLWKDGKDYDHGTGHGVGHYLSVHEGPQGISKRPSHVPLMPGMIISNEPGYYKAGEYGIRIENLVLVVEQENGFLGFETLTLAPLDNTLINHGMLTDQERDWVHDYEERVEQNLIG